MSGYIGTKASVVSSGAERKKVFDITATTTSLTGCSYTPNQVHVFHNGVRLVDGTDYTATDGSTVTLTTAAQSGDEVVVISYATFQPADAYTKTESDDRYYTKTESDSQYVDVTGDTMTGALNITASGSGSAGSLNINATDPFIRFYDSNGTTDIRKFDVRVVGGSEGFVIRAVNDANTSFVTRLAINSNGYLKCQGVYNDSAADSANVVVDGSGNIYRSTSALKYKQDIRDIEEIDISQFRPVRYKSNLERDDQTKDHFGFIADEAHDAGYTELVSYGVPDEETGIAEVEGFRYDRMTVLLTKVIQQQQATIDALEARVAALEAV